jgi:imidazolonepropionase-like amidohydrolase
MIARHSIACLLGLLVSAPLTAQEKPIAFVNARILPVEGDPIEQGVLVVKDGKIAAIGIADAVKPPADAQTFDMSGKTIVPGLVDTHNHIGGVGGADGSAPIQPDVRIYDSLNVRDSGFKRAVAGGLTTLNIIPGSGHLLSGQTVYVKLRGGRTIEDLMIRDADGKPTGGMKMANGTNSRGTPPFPGTRGKSAALVREQYIKAQEYRRSPLAAGNPERCRRASGTRAGRGPDGKRVVHHHTPAARHYHRAAALEGVRLRVVLHHVSEAWKVADEIAPPSPCSDSRGFARRKLKPRN